MKAPAPSAPRPAVPGKSGAPPPVGLLRMLGFFSGGSVMIVEFCGNRLLAPGFGNSLYTWTALIGVILLALSCGDYIGGRLVDRVPHLGLLPVLFSLGGVLTALIPALAPLLPDFSTMDLIMGPVKISLVLFFLPGLVLAAITPVSIRLLSKAQSDANIGRSAGTVGMAAALGSFTGTMATTYILIPAFGVHLILLMLGGLLLALGLALGVLWRGRLRGAGPLVLLAVIGAGVLVWGASPPAPGADVLHQQDTFYHRIRVSSMPGSAGRTARLLKLDSTFEGAQVVETGELLFDYQQYWRLADVFCPQIDHAIFLGAGAFGMPEQLSQNRPGAAVDVVEIDPAVIEVGRRFFRLNDFPRVTAHAADARRFLETTPVRYDLIFGDAYHGVQYIPAHLVTREFFAGVRSRLTDGGVFMMNIIGAVQGPGAKLFWCIANSLQPSFPHVQVYAASNNPFVEQNLIIVASATDLDAAAAAFRPAANQGALRRLLDSRMVLPPPQSADLFTDDHNPVEYVVAQQLRTK